MMVRLLTCACSEDWRDCGDCIGGRTRSVPGLGIARKHVVAVASRVHVIASVIDMQPTAEGRIFK